MQDLAEQLSAKEQETAELDAMLEEAQTESESHQAALRDCQDMLEELQTFSQGQEVKMQQLQSDLQVFPVLVLAQFSLKQADRLTGHAALPALNTPGIIYQEVHMHCPLEPSCSASTEVSFPCDLWAEWHFLQPHHMSR